jgi:HTH-type transcriptional regulator/antitoxin HipB
MEACVQQILVSPTDFGSAVRDLRNDQGLTQADLGELVGLDQKKVSLIENGNPNIRVDSLFRLLSALGVGIMLEPKIPFATPDLDEW